MQSIEAAVKAGTDKATRSLGQLFTRSVLAGAFIALGGVLSIIVGYGFPGITAANPALQRVLSGLVFPIGLFLIVMLGADLFTGNNALLMTSLGERKITSRQVAVNWLLVWIGNFIGCLLFAYLLVYACGLLDSEPYRSAAIGIAQGKAALSPWVTVGKGIGANWLVCMAVWLALGANTLGGKALACWIPVAAFVTLGYEHAIANMFYLPVGLMAGADVSIGSCAVNLLCATLGNIIGGALLVGKLFHRMYRKS